MLLLFTKRSYVDEVNVCHHIPSANREEINLHNIFHGTSLVTSPLLLLAQATLLLDETMNS